MVALTNKESNQKEEHSFTSVRLHQQRNRNKDISERPNVIAPSTSEEQWSNLSILSLDSVWTDIVDKKVGEEEKKRLLNKLVKEACDRGQYREILELLRQKVGPGSDRNILITTFFSNANVPFTELEELVEGLDFKTERVNASRAIASRVSSSIQDVPISLFQSKSKSIISALSEGVEKYLRSGPANISYMERLNQTLDVAMLMPDDLRKKTFSSAFGTSCGSNNPFEAWSFLQSNGQVRDAMVNDEDLYRMSVAMINRDPKKALALIKNDTKSELMSNAFQYYLRKDPQAASEWFESNRNSLSKLQQSLFYEASALHELRSGNSDYAIEHAEVIDDPAIRKDVLEKIRKSKE